jgi:hypothetical protein
MVRLNDARYPDCRVKHLGLAGLGCRVSCRSDHKQVGRIGLKVVFVRGLFDLAPGMYVRGRWPRRGLSR